MSSTIFVCPKCKSISTWNDRCFRGTYCDRDEGEERQEYALVEKQQPNKEEFSKNPFKVGDLVVWKNTNGFDEHEAVVLTVTENSVVSGLVRDKTITRKFAWCDFDGFGHDWRCGCMTLARKE